jgi:hypothetical protein
VKVYETARRERGDGVGGNHEAAIGGFVVPNREDWLWNQVLFEKKRMKPNGMGAA